MNLAALTIFIGLVMFIVLLYARRKRIESGMTDFYKEHSLFTTKDEPPHIRESLEASGNLYCCRSNIMTTAGASVEFCWWEWFLTSNTMINGVPSASFANYLAVSFAPNAVSEDFVQRAIRFADTKGDDFAQKAKDFFVHNVEKPYRAEKLADGSLVICWRVTKQRDVYEAKIEWLKNNLSAPVNSEIIEPETIQNADVTETKTGENVSPIESKTIEAVAPIQPQFIESATQDESGIVRVDFYRHDNYATLERRLTSGWANLGLELNHASAKFQHEGWDIMDAEATFGDLDKPNEIVFTLTDETLAEEATQHFSEFSGGTAYVVRSGQYPVESAETLAYCNNPFRLALDEFTYAEFKRRFSTRWTNLSVLIRPAPRETGEPKIHDELAEEFDMKRLKHADKAFLHDYIYISDWMDKLVYVRINALIRNKKLGVDCVGNFRNLKLKTFNKATSEEHLRRMSI